MISLEIGTFAVRGLQIKWPFLSRIVAITLERLASIHKTIGDRLALPSKQIDRTLVLNFGYGKSS